MRGRSAWLRNTGLRCLCADLRLHTVPLHGHVLHGVADTGGGRGARLDFLADLVVCL